MDKIIIQGLELEALIGVYDWEREAKQNLIVDVCLVLDLHQAAKSDDVSDTIDYAKLAETLSSLADNSEFQLLEALADHMIKHLLAHYPIKQATIKICKPKILTNAQSVAVELTREA